MDSFKQALRLHVRSLRRHKQGLVRNHGSSSVLPALVARFVRQVNILQIARASWARLLFLFLDRVQV